MIAMRCNPEALYPSARAFSGQRGVTLERRQALDSARTLAGREQQSGDSLQLDSTNNGFVGRNTLGPESNNAGTMQAAALPVIPGRSVSEGAKPFASKSSSSHVASEKTRLGAGEIASDAKTHENGTSQRREVSDTMFRLLRGNIAREVGPEAYARYFGSDVTIRQHSERLTLEVPTRFLAGLMERRFGGMLREAVRSASGFERHAIEIVALDESGGPVSPASDIGTIPGRNSDSRKTSSSLADAPPAGKREDSGRLRPTKGGRNGSRSSQSDRQISVAAERYRLEDFIVGASNRLVYDAAVRVAESEPFDSPTGDRSEPASRSEPRRASCSPLFIHGQCGLGKTHLLQGIAARFKQHRPGAIVRFTTGEAFTNDFISAIHGDGARSTNHSAKGSGGSPNGAGGNGAGGGGGGTVGMERFRKQYRRVDLLCIDDVHFLANKSATQTELLHTFNELDLGGAQIVLACDEHPRLVKKISEALISRFMSGMVARVDSPDRELCERIMRRFGERRGLVFEDSALKALSARTAALSPGVGASSRTEAAASKGMSIREIEGLVTRVEACVRMNMTSGQGGVCRVGLAAVQQVLGSVGSAGAALAREFDTTKGQPSLSPSASDQRGAFLNGREPYSGSTRQPVRLEAIVAQTCRLLGVDLGDFTGTGRQPRAVLARSITAHLARRLTRMSFPEIARGMGRPSHSTIIAAARRLEQQLAAADGSKVAGLDLTLGELCDRLEAAVVARA